jgi:hypothetical protein
MERRRFPDNVLFGIPIADYFRQLHQHSDSGVISGLQGGDC